jgi:hypothetical protein
MKARNKVQRTSLLLSGRPVKSIHFSVKSAVFRPVFEPYISQIQIALVIRELVCSVFTNTTIIIIIIIIIIIGGDGDGGGEGGSNSSSGSNFFPSCTFLISVSLQARLENIPPLMSAMHQVIILRQAFRCCKWHL